MPDYTKFLQVATEAARAAGAFLLANFEGKQDIHYKGKDGDHPFSEADKEAERIILDIICKACPTHAVVSEETGELDRQSDYRWVIDPLDGTVNYLHKYPNFSTSIALMHKDKIIVGVIFNPVTDEMFTAISGKGTSLNGKKVHVSTVAKLDKGLFGAGFPYDRESAAFRRSLNNFIFFAKSGQAVRREGSTALSLCNVASGRYEGFSVAGNDPWDYAAGVLLVTEAGGKVTDFDGNPFEMERREILATNGKVHPLTINHSEEV